VRRAIGRNLGLLALSFMRLEQVRMTLPVLDTRARGAVFYEQPVGSILNPPESTGMGYWSANPYVGCEFGCTYCYARFTHGYVVRRATSSGRLPVDNLGDFEAFEYRIFVKRRESALAALERDLARLKRRRAAGEDTHIVLGTATDPYQPAERKFLLSRAILERLSAERGLSIEIISKSPLISRDIDVLTRIQQNNRLTIHISLITTDVRLIKTLEVRTPMPRARLRALARLSGAGLNAGLIVAPVLPGINDTVPLLGDLLAAAKRSGARFAHPSPLRLYASIRDHFLLVMDANFPELAARYRQVYQGFGAAPREYVVALSKRFRAVARRCGIAVGQMISDHSVKARVTERQLGLWAEQYPNLRRR
jgi:DNA repair photolyase